MSVNQTENKRKGIHQIGYCLKYLMTFLSPYKGGLILGLDGDDRLADDKRRGADDNTAFQ